MKKVSVIIPIYNVESYLRRCIDSVINQTYQNLEIILVDDGSPDCCGSICDKYAQIDRRIRVIHKNNGGLSDARNAGLDIADGDYIGFVDSDDYIAKDMYEFLVNLIVDNDADIAICGMYYVKNKKIETTKRINSLLKMDSESAIKEMLQESTFNTSVCDKLYKRNLFDTVRYPDGRFFEDVFTTYKLLDEAKKIVFSSEPKYYYISIANSIMNSAPTPRKIEDFNKASAEIITFVSSKYKKLRDSAINRCVRYNVSFMRQIVKLKFADEETIEKIRNIVKRNLFAYLLSRYKFSSKLFAVVLIINYPLLRFVCRTLILMFK